MTDIYLWNNSSLSSPPINTYKCLETNIDKNKLINIIEEAVSVLKNQDNFHKEAAVLSRLIYKLGKKFRHDIGFSYLRKTNVALSKYLNLNILNDINTFLDVISNAMKDYYPTRQMMEFILIRLQTFSKLMCRITECSKKAGYFYLERVRRGDAWWLSFMPYIVICRIWYLSKHLVKNSCKWYNNLYFYKDTLKIIGVPFIPNSYEFPCNLEEWLDTDALDDNFDCENILNKWSSQDLQSMFENDSERQSFNISRSTDNNEHDSVVIDLSPNDNLRISKISEDIGETLSREKYAENLANKSNIPQKHNTIKNIKSENIQILSETNISKHNDSNSENNRITKYFHTIDVICNVKACQRFIDAEESFRENDNEKSLTIHLGFMQWQSLKTGIERLAVKINDKNKTKMKLKIKKLWKEKCVDMK